MFASSGSFFDPDGRRALPLGCWPLPQLAEEPDPRKPPAAAAASVPSPPTLRIAFSTTSGMRRLQITMERFDGDLQSGAGDPATVEAYDSLFCPMSALTTGRSLSIWTKLLSTTFVVSYQQSVQYISHKSLSMTLIRACMAWQA
jgi:hypothetical protein